MPIPARIHQLWWHPDNQAPHPTLLKCQESVKAAHPGYEYHYWDNSSIDGLFSMKYPGNGIVPDLTEKELRDFFQALTNCNRGKTLPVRADLLKLMMLYQYGGFFLDHDMYCLRPLDDYLKDDYFFGYATEFWLIGEHIIGAPEKDYYILGILHSFIRTGILNSIASISLTDWCIRFNLLQWVKPSIVTCPHAYFEANEGRNLYVHNDQTRFIHLFSQAYERDLYDFGVLEAIRATCKPHRKLT